MPADAGPEAGELRQHGSAAGARRLLMQPAAGGDAALRASAASDVGLLYRWGELEELLSGLARDGYRLAAPQHELDSSLAALVADAERVADEVSPLPGQPQTRPLPCHRLLWPGMPQGEPVGCGARPQQPGRRPRLGPPRI